MTGGTNPQADLIERSRLDRDITVLYFAAASSATNLMSEIIELPVPSFNREVDNYSGFPLSSLGSLLATRYPHTKLEEVLKTSRWSVDAEMIEEGEESNVLLKGGEEVAVICPVSGG